MSERLEEMLRIAQRMKAADEALNRKGGAISPPVSLDPIWDDRWADYDSAFTARTAEALVKVALALIEVRKIVSEGAMEGFNPKVGDWAERLFASQGDTSRALSALTVAMASEDGQSPAEGLSEAKPSEEDNSNVG